MKRTGKPLSRARVHLAGVGRVGSGVALGLHEAGVGEISCNDPQMFEAEQLRVLSYGRCSDLGKPKVHVLERFFDGRPGLRFIPLVARNQSRALQSYLERADLVISCANDLDARLHVERAAVHSGKPSIQACVQDARSNLGGTVSIWKPERNFACFGCLFPTRKSLRRDEILLPAVTHLVASIAVSLGLDILAGNPRSQANLFAIDAGTVRVERFSIKPRQSCCICCS